MKLFFSVLSVVILSPLLALAEIDYKQIQTDLNRMGYKVGTADGIPGRNTRRGIKEFFNDAGYVAPGEMTLSEQEYIHAVAEFTDQPTSFLKKIVTQELSIRDLSDDDLCKLHYHLDLMDSFDEVEIRGLGCKPYSQRIVKYDGQLLNDPISTLRKFQQNYDIEIPKFDLTSAKTFADWSTVVEAYNFLNPAVGQVVNVPWDRDRIAFCVRWLPQAGSISADATKNLDGSSSWNEDTLQDAAAICEFTVSSLYLGGLSSNKILAERSQRSFIRMMQRIVQDDRINLLPFRRYSKSTNPRAGQADPTFAYTTTVARLLAGTELYTGLLDWDQEMQRAYAAWARDRVLQAMPVSGRVGKLSSKACNWDIRDWDDMDDACMNAAPYMAQSLLRAAIAGNDQELAELSYLVFKQYSSAIRPDGSPAHDSARECVAADYVLEASEYLHDYIYLASRAGVDLWDDSFSERHGSPKKHVEFGIALMQDPTLVNKYLLDPTYPDCEYEDGQMVQQMKRAYPWSAYAYYLYEFDMYNFENIYWEIRDHIESYTAQSGVNYEVDLLLQKPELIDYFIKNEERIMERYQ